LYIVHQKLVLINQVKKKIIFLDRDGVINEEVNYLRNIEDFVFIEGIFKSMHYLKELGYEFIIITNQSGIARGLYSEADYKKIDLWMKSVFKKHNLDILDSIHCPHKPEDDCNCRKPKPGMFDFCFQKYSISKENSWMIGDSKRDIEASLAAGINNNILVRSGHPISEGIKNIPIIDSIKEIHEVIN